MLCSIYDTGQGDRGSGRGGRFSGIRRGRGRVERGRQGRGVHFRGGRGGVSGAYENGIDISDVIRYFEYSWWDALSNDTRKSITEHPVRTKFMVNKKRRTTSYVTAKKDNKNWLISQIITRVKDASRN